MKTKPLAAVQHWLYTANSKLVRLEIGRYSSSLYDNICLTFFSRSCLTGKVFLELPGTVVRKTLAWTVDKPKFKNTLIHLVNNWTHILSIKLCAKALRSKRWEVFLSIWGSCYTTLDAKLFEYAATLLPGFIGTYLHRNISTQLFNK